MLHVGNFKSRTCAGLNRRSFLKLSTGLPLAFSATGIPRLAQAADERKAKSVILVWLWGAPSHLDLVDPKPHAPQEYRGPFCPIQTKTPGLQFTELLPQLSQRTDQFTLIRSMVSSNGGHPGAGTVGLTGFEESPGPVQPNFGAIISKSQTQPGDLPPFFYVGRGIPRDLPRRIKGYGGGTLGPAHDPFLVNCTPLGEVEMPGLRLLDGLTPDRINNRQDLLQRIDGTRRLADGSDVANWSRVYKTAYNLLTKPEAVKSFDLTEESESTREQYGYTKFGQSCLLARRLVEAEVPYIQVNWSEYVEAMSPGCDFGWDTHIYNFELLQDRHGPVFDRAFSALLDDLKQRGLLETTLVLAMGEFGRTPKINKRAARDHWPRCYFSMWAGAGIEPGRVIGESDRRGEDPVTEPITPLMVGTTVAELCGVTAQTRAEMQVLDGGKVIEELV